ncbi:MAG: sortase [Candidatus Saccharibacteria bacterium]|nr:sortase [Candidatus Saccharibacteria bacterium]
MLQLKKQKSPWIDRLLIIVAILMIGGGGYLLITAFSPFLFSQFINPNNNSTTQLLEATANQPDPERFREQRLYIPKIDVNVLYASGSPETLDKGAWWRKSANGNPKDGGNFVIAAHRFQIGPTPHRTINNSPFYNIDRLKVGDDITVDYDGKRYEYAIAEIRRVDPDAVEIEERTKEPRLTLYTCTLGGTFDGREVIFATPKQPTQKPAS